MNCSPAFIVLSKYKDRIGKNYLQDPVESLMENILSVPFFRVGHLPAQAFRQLK
jgi:hypothetical protein